MNILVADDERAIREGVKRTIHQLHPDYGVHLAASTEEAVQILGGVHIDIVLTDILMPGLSGLEFMRISKRKYPYAKWVVISAHSEFSYAQEAVRLGARDYLLKPIGKNRLQALISGLVDEIEQEQTQTRDSERLRMNLKYLREGVFQRLASGLDISHLDTSPFMEQYRSFYLVLVQLDAGERNVHLEHFVVDNILSELFERYGSGFVVSYDRESLLGLVALRPEVQIESLQEEAKGYIRRYVQVPFHMVHSGLIQDFHVIPGLVMRMRQASAVQELNPLKGGGEKAIEVALQYIKEHYNEDISLEKVAATVFLNPAYFSQLFKQKTGQGYKEYVINLRLEQAKRLLLNPKLKLADIAVRIGYQDMRHFTQLFRKRFCITPTEYRQQQRINVL